MTYDNPPIITSTMRRYNPQTGRYKSVVTDPWSGAPKGIRVISSIAGGRFVMLEDRFVYRPQGAAGWTSGSQANIAKEVAWHSSIGSEFPDFDGAPEGQRFYVKWGSTSAFEPGVDTGDGVYVLIRGKWWKQSGVYGLEWYRDNGVEPILVDPTPAEPKLVPNYNLISASSSIAGRADQHSYEPKPGDVIRDKSNHLETWYFTGNYWDKITRCGRVPADEFTPPKRMEIVSRAVN